MDCYNSREEYVTSSNHDKGRGEDLQEEFGLIGRNVRRC